MVKAFRHLEKVKQEARALGIFTDERELLECPSCGLLEDVTGRPCGGYGFINKLEKLLGRRLWALPCEHPCEIEKTIK